MNPAAEGGVDVPQQSQRTELYPNPSLWELNNKPSTRYPRLEGKESKVDVCVVGGGICGMTAAYLLKKRGYKVALLEARTVGSGVTGHSTAKVTSLHTLAYTQIEKKWGQSVTKVYAEMCEAALEQVSSIVDELKVECDFSRRSNFVYTTDKSKVAIIREELEACKRAGLPVLFTTRSEMPFEIAAGIQLDNQAQMDPVPFTNALAKSISEAEGCSVYENTRVTDVATHNMLHEVKTAHGASIKADHVVLATHLPLLDRGGYFMVTHPERSYLMAARIEDPNWIPKGMWISIDGRTRTLRSANNDSLLVFGGESHVQGNEPDTSKCFDNLEEWANKHYNIKETVARWGAMDYMPADLLPYIGPLDRLESTIWVATGFKKWGFTLGTGASMILADIIAGRPNPWAKTFSSVRFAPIKSAAGVAQEAVQSAAHFIGDRVKDLLAPAVQTIRPGEGRIANLEGTTVAAYRDEDGKLFAVSPDCTHLGCRVRFNKADRCWDCPCHGSIFSVTGEVLHGPAVKDLKQYLADQF